MGDGGHGSGRLSKLVENDKNWVNWPPLTRNQAANKAKMVRDRP